MSHRASHDSAGRRGPHGDAKDLRARLSAAQQEQRDAMARLEEVDTQIDALGRRRDELLAVLAAAEVTEKGCAEDLERLDAALPALPVEDTPYQFKTIEITELTPEPVEAPAPKKAAFPSPRIEAPAPRKAAPPPPPVEAPAPRKAAPPPPPVEAHGLSLEVQVGDDEAEVHALHDDGFLIGRGPKNDLVLKVAGVSRTHAKIVRDAEGTYVITDVSSGGGMAVNGHKRKEAPLEVGDRILIADVELRVCAGGATSRR